MRIGSASDAHSSISASNADTVIVRGHDLSKSLIGNISFTDHIWLLVVGKLPTQNQRRILDAALVAIAEHGLVPSVVAARMTLAASPEALQGAVAAGLMGCGSVILGSSQAAGEFFKEIENETVRGEELGAAIRTTVTRYRRDRRAIPGYGHPLHKGGDPRAKRLYQLAEELGVYGIHSKAAHEVERRLPELIGKSLSINISAAIPSVLMDAGYPIGALKGIPILARTASLVAHLLEEQTRPIGFLMAQAASAAITFDGPAPNGFLAEEN